MEKRTLGKTGMKVSVLGFGAAEIGFRKESPETVSRLLNAALDAGLNVIDTAECYDSGPDAPGSEELIGRTAAHRRGDYYLLTKVGHTAGLEGQDWDPEMMTRSIERSLQRLRTDCVDLIQLHTCGEDLLRKGDVIEVLRKARDAGKTRFIGYSGDSKAALYAVECGAFDTLQTSVSIGDQECIDLTLPKARAADMGVIAKRPVANVAWMLKSEQEARNRFIYPYWSRLHKLAYPFLQSGGPEAVGTTLRFTLTVPGVHTAIVGTSNPDRWKENAALLAAGPLSEEEYRSIRERWQEVAEPDWVGQG